jgi:hypothetical protein
VCVEILQTERDGGVIQRSWVGSVLGGQRRHELLTLLRIGQLGPEAGCGTPGVVPPRQGTKVPDLAGERVGASVKSQDSARGVRSG